MSTTLNEIETLLEEKSLMSANLPISMVVPAFNSNDSKSLLGIAERAILDKLADYPEIN
jgi:hypothetical protein